MAGAERVAPLAVELEGLLLGIRSNLEAACFAGGVEVVLLLHPRVVPFALFRIDIQEAECFPARR